MFLFFYCKSIVQVDPAGAELLCGDARAGKGLRHGTVLQIGYGIVGREAAEILFQKGIDFVLYDKDWQKLSGVSYKVAADRKEIRNYPYILDFTNKGGWLDREDLAENVLYTSPGVPYSMDEEAAAAFEPRSIHDNLEIGTAVMLMQRLLDTYKDHKIGVIVNEFGKINIL